MIKRRPFIAGLGGVVVWPLAAVAQQDGRVRRIGLLSGFHERDPISRALAGETVQALSRLGWENGRNVQIVQRWTAGDFDRTTMFAKELVACGASACSCR
jgi:putative tryptophan/tyrosine transport system substrate-binding protein